MKRVLQEDGSIDYTLLILKWFALCSVNSIFSFITAFTTDYHSLYAVVSMIMGIITFIFLYAYVEERMIAKQQVIRRSMMNFGVLVHIPLQLFPPIDFILGVISTGLVKNLLNIPFPFHVYFITIIQGLLLSLVCFIFGSFVYWLSKKIKHYRLKKRNKERA